MLKEELKKLYIKHFGFAIMLIVIVGGIILINFSYTKQEFASENSKQNYCSYMERFSGKLTAEKEAEIIAEQELITDANNIRRNIEINLTNGEYSEESEYISEYENALSIAKRKESFDVLFEKYSYSLDDPEKRYITAGNYSGLARDYPDVFLLSAVIFLTTVLFLNEENSNVITTIRISVNGRQKTLRGKIISILLLTATYHLFSVILELSEMISVGNITELSYPVQSVVFFQNCPYNISILQLFLVVSALKLLGYFFVEALIILLSVTVRKSLPAVFVPSALCLLQQFAFNPATPAYYIPTGFLRAVGYFRGNVYENNSLGEEMTVFSEIPFSYLVFLIVFTILFILVSIVAANYYYSCKSIKLRNKGAYAAALLMLCGTFSGCSANSGTQTESVVFNLRESSFFAQNDTYYFTSDENGIARISKADGSKIYIPQDEFYAESIGKVFMLCGDTLYYNDFLGGVDISFLSLDTLKTEKFFGKSNYNSKEGFLGIKRQINSELFGLNLVTSFFTNGKEKFIVCDTSVYQIQNDKPVCIIDRDIHNQMLCYDGKSIYYVNGLLRLCRYDISSGKTTRLNGEIVSAIYYDGTRLLYSDKNGIFSLDLKNYSEEKLSPKTADSISSDGKNIVYSKDGALFLLCDGEDEKLTENTPDSYAVISGKNKVLIAGKISDDSFNQVDLPIK